MTTKRAICVCAAAAVVLSAAYLTYENNALKLTEYNYASAKVPPAFDGFKICHLSDIHVKSAKKTYASLLKLVSAQKPDIIVISGDLIDSRTSHIPSALSLVKRLASVAPVYYVTGNHEEKNLPFDLYEKVVDGLSALGVHMMDNRAEIIGRGGEYINIAGLFDGEEVFIEETAARFDKNTLNILISHRPQFAEDYARSGADLTFTGHAHGGQVRIPFVGGLLAPDQYFFPEYYEGIHYFDGRATVISRGIGNSLIPFRINNRPEVVVVTLRAEEA